METFDNMQLITVGMSQSVKPRLFIEPHCVNNKSRFTFPMTDGSTHPEQIRIGWQGTTIHVDPADNVIVLVEQENRFRSLYELKWTRMEIDAWHARWITLCEHRIVGLVQCVWASF